MTMRVFCVVATEESDTDPLSFDIVGVFARREAARGRMLGRIMDRAEGDSLFAYCLIHDENHDDLPGYLEGHGASPREWDGFFDREAPAMRMPDLVRKAMEGYLGENARDSYYVYARDCRGQSYGFRVEDAALEEA